MSNDAYVLHGGRPQICVLPCLAGKQRYWLLQQYLSLVVTIAKYMLKDALHSSKLRCAEYTISLGVVCMQENFTILQRGCYTRGPIPGFDMCSEPKLQQCSYPLRKVRNDFETIFNHTSSPKFILVKRE